VRGFVVLAALFGAALLYGDGIITPAISVLSAVEGLGVATHAFDSLVVPITMVILLGLFLVQKRGTDRIGKFFGPVMLLWFIALTVLGVMGIAQAPSVLQGLNPLWAVRLFQADPERAFLVLGAVVLCITGGEALYADMGHFGARPIRLNWYFLVFPSLLVNYFGQGAYLLKHGFVEKPFWALVPQPLLFPMVGLATAAAVIASQALISGAFSLTRQAVQLGYLPRVTLVHTSATNEGQIYVPEVNQALMVACLTLVLVFKQSSGLAGAYGIAVTGTMGITSIVYYFVVTRNWGWSWKKALPLVLLFLSFDVPFFLANVIKVFDGGWFPILIGLAMYALMTTWKRGREELSKRFNALMPVSTLLEDLEATKPFRVRGTAVFMSGNSEGTPPVLLHHLKHNQVLHRQVVLLSIVPSRRADGAQGRAADGQRPGQRLLSHHLAHGLHGDSAGAPNSAARAGAGAGLRAVDHQLLPGPRDAAHGRWSADDAVAQGALCIGLAQRPIGDQLLWPSTWARRRAGYAGRPLKRRFSSSYSVHGGDAANAA
jgi:KUP system potassium uptake protein